MNLIKLNDKKKKEISGGVVIMGTAVFMVALTTGIEFMAQISSNYFFPEKNEINKKGYIKEKNLNYKFNNNKTENVITIFTN